MRGERATFTYGRESGIQLLLSVSFFAATRERDFHCMSMETHVFFRGKLPTNGVLSRAMKELGFPFSINPAAESLEQQSGFMPMLLRRDETGVEFDVYSDHFVIEEFADVGVDQSFERMASFRWGGDFREAVAGMCAAAALAKLTVGVVFDEAENKLLSVDGAIDVARKNLQHLPKRARTGKPRGPTVLKRMLAPLLATRNDLVLVNALLIIRPVRHLIRGAEFRWHHARTVCSVCPYIRPLYQPSEVFLEDAALSATVESRPADVVGSHRGRMLARRRTCLVASTDDRRMRPFSSKPPP